MKDFIELALRTEAEPTVEVCNRMVRCAREMHAMMGLATEVGELIDQYKKHIFYGKPLDRVNVNEELGDLCWYLALGMHANETTFEAEMERVINKLRTRYPERFTESAATTRDLHAERKTLEATPTPGCPG